MTCRSTQSDDSSHCLTTARRLIGREAAVVDDVACVGGSPTSTAEIRRSPDRIPTPYTIPKVSFATLFSVPETASSRCSLSFSALELSSSITTGLAWRRVLLFHKSPAAALMISLAGLGRTDRFSHCWCLVKCVLGGLNSSWISSRSSSRSAMSPRSPADFSAHPLTGLLARSASLMVAPPLGPH